MLQMSNSRVATNSLILRRKASWVSLSILLVCNLSDLSDLYDLYDLRSCNQTWVQVPVGAFNQFFSKEYVEREKEKRCPYTYMYVPFHCHICVSPLYENPDGFLGRYACSDEEKIESQGSSTVTTLYFETCYVASMVSPGGVVVITPD